MNDDDLVRRAAITNVILYILFLIGLGIIIWVIK